jgi:dynein heavy chain
MNVVLVQEASRYNRLLGLILGSLEALLLALKGEAVATAETEAALSSILRNTVPEIWLKKSYPSVKPLSSWIEDLKERTAMLDRWIELGTKPAVVWISGLFFPQSFLTAIKQDYARRFSYPIDLIEVRP